MSDGRGEGTPNDERTLWRIAATVGVAQLGFATVLPLLPLHLTEHLGASVKLVGLVVATFALVETFFKTAWGGVTDRMGRRPIVVAGLLLSAVAPAVMAVLRAPALFVPLRFVDGLGSAALWPAAAAAVGDVTTPNRRATGMAMLNLAFLLGLALGPSLGLFAAGLAGSYRAGFYMASTLLLAAAVMAAVGFPRDGRAGRAGARGGPRPPDLSGGPTPSGLATPPGFPGAGRSPRLRAALDAARASPLLFGLYLVAFVQMFGVGLLVPIAAIYARVVIGLSQHAIGVLFLAIVVAVALSTVPAGRLADRVGKRRLIEAGMAVGALGMWIIPFSHRLEELIAGGVLLGISYALTAPAWLAMVSELAPPGRMGLAVGASETVQGLGLVLGPLLGGLLWDALGPQAPFVASAGILTAGTAIAVLTLRPAGPARGRGSGGVGLAAGSG